MTAYLKEIQPSDLLFRNILHRAHGCPFKHIMYSNDHDDCRA